MQEELAPTNTLPRRTHPFILATHRSPKLSTEFTCNMMMSPLFTIHFCGLFHLVGAFFE